MFLDYVVPDMYVVTETTPISVKGGAMCSDVQYTSLHTPLENQLLVLFVDRV